MLGDMLAFGSLVERALEVFLATLLGVVLIAHWDWRALIVAGALFLVIRPLIVMLMPFRGMLDARQRSCRDGSVSGVSVVSTTCSMP